MRLFLSRDLLRDLLLRLLLSLLLLRLRRLLLCCSSLSCLLLLALLLRNSGDLDLDLVCDLLRFVLTFSALLLLVSLSFGLPDWLRLLFSSFLDPLRSREGLLLEDRLDKVGLLLRLLLLPWSDFRSDAFLLSLESSLIDSRLVGFSSLLLLLMSALPCFLLFSTVSLRLSASRTLPFSAALLNGDHPNGQWLRSLTVQDTLEDE